MRLFTTYRLSLNKRDRFERFVKKRQIYFFRSESCKNELCNINIDSNVDNVVDIRTDMFQCVILLEFINGTASNPIRILENFKQPTEFQIENWQAIDEDAFTWQLKETITYEGVQWLESRHSSQDGENECWGIAKFKFLNEIVRIVEDGMILKFE
jgi:hypothetical protein